MSGALLAGSVASASAATIPDENWTGTMVIRVEIPERTAAPTPPPEAGGGGAGGGSNNGGGDLAGTGIDPSLLILLAAAGLVAVGTGATVVARRRANSVAAERS